MITTNRNQYIAAHVKKTVKTALRHEANRRRCSVSALVSEILSKALEKLGYDLKEKEKAE